MTGPGGYIDDFAYPHLFHREMTPVWIAAVLAARGQAAPDITAPYDWCDLGCGTGFGTVLTAAANPPGRFTGIDFNQGHVEHGTGLAAEAGVTNVGFIAADFADPVAAGSAMFDFIVCHGVWSWLSPDRQAAVLDFIDRRLKPGGVVYLHYMCHPGMSAFQSLRHYLHRHARGIAGPLQDRVLSGLRQLQAMGQAGAGYFAVNPLVLSQGVERALADDPRFLVHELLNEHWQPQHVGDVITRMASIGCGYAGSAVPFDNIDEVCLPGATAGLVKGVRDVAEAEALRDMARNQARRQDLYRRGGARLSGAQQIAALCRFSHAALAGAPATGKVIFDTPIGPVEGDAAQVAPVLEALASGPKPFEVLARLPAFRGNATTVSRILSMLTFAGLAHPLLPGDRPGATGINRVIAARIAQGFDYRWQVVPALGSALPADGGKA